MRRPATSVTLDGCPPDHTRIEGNNIVDHRPHILVVTGDTLGEKMAGPAIRAWHIALGLRATCDVKLVSLTKCTLDTDELDVAFNDAASLRNSVAWADAVVFQGHLLHHHPWIINTDAVIVADIYDPIHLESLEQGRDLSQRDRASFSLQTAEVLNVQMERADFLMCASEKQRDFWLGQLAALGRINPATYEVDNSLRSLLAVVPFGVQDEAPIQTRPAIKGVVPGIEHGDEVILWGGGIYNWFDPLTLIRAVAIVERVRPNVRLFFMGMNHPNPDVPVMSMSVRARQLAEELGLMDRLVFFNREWVDYQDRANYLLDADLGVSTHFDHIETAYSFRTRVLDYLWAGLPVVSTRGDTFESIILENGFGKVVDPEDVEGLADALIAALDPEEKGRLAENSLRYGEHLQWSKVLRPLIEFCTAPRTAPDRLEGLQSARADKLDSLQRHIDDLHSSTSWRVTAPLRAMIDVARKARPRRP